MPLFKKLKWWTRELPIYLMWKPVLSLTNMGKTYRYIFVVDCR